MKEDRIYLAENASFWAGMGIVALFLSTISLSILMFVFSESFILKTHATIIAFQKVFSVNAIFVSVFLMYASSKGIIFLIPRLRQAHLYPSGFISHDGKLLYFGDETIHIRDIVQCEHDLHVAFRNPYHYLFITNKYGKTYKCHYVFKNKPEELCKTIEDLPKLLEQRS